MIRVLPDIVQNKIAAGEVVERPAAAVKELVENAIDAGATRISVEIEEGGMRRIRVADDGCGMTKDDLQLSILRHATSKIHEVEDIFAISTMGFRGEALPSIGSVSRLSISSCTQGQEEGCLLRVIGGKAEGVIPAPPRKGTLVEVEDLFFNTPARRKFMKSPAAEMGAINESITRIALANPGVAFKIRGNNKPVMELAARDNLEERIRDLFGKSIALYPVEYTTSSGELTISGYCGKPGENRGNSRSIYTLLNKRWIKHPGMIRGIIDAYQGSLPPRRYPFAVICLTIDPARVDINAHPTKEVVRFENDSLFVGGCRKAIEQTLLGGGGESDKSGIAGVESTDSLRRLTESSIQHYISENRVNNLAEARSSYRSSSAPLQPNRYGTGGRNVDSNATERNLVGEFSGRRGETFEQRAQPAVESENVRSGQSALELPLVGGYRYLGQVGGKYILAESEDGVIFIDQHALHESWNYSRLTSRERVIDSQGLLLPVEIELNAVEEALLSQSAVVLEEAGFDFDLKGSTLLIKAHPDIVRPHNIEQVVRDVLSDLDTSAVQEYRDRINASLACHTAVLFNTNLSDELCIDLLQKLAAGSLLSCPHGRPTKIVFSWKELAARFQR